MDWTSVLSISITVALVVVIMTTTRTSRTRTDPEDGTVSPSYGLGPKLAAWLFTALATLMAVVPLVRGTNIELGFGVAAIAMIPAVLMFLELRTVAAFDDAGLRTASVWGGHRTTTWDEIRRVKWSGPSYSFVLRTRGGRRLRVPGLAQGPAAFADTVEAGLSDRGGAKAVRRWSRNVPDARNR